jgi:hypothetical protein
MGSSSGQSERISIVAPAGKHLDEANFSRQRFFPLMHLELAANRLGEMLRSINP